MYENNHFPCLHCHPHTYIRMVHNLIERCLLLHMDREQCVKALLDHARIQPLVTLTVWKELMKKNKDFFQSYFQSLSSRHYTSRRICSKDTKIFKKKAVLEIDKNCMYMRMKKRPLIP